jgi:hypothetical protein
MEILAVIASIIVIFLIIVALQPSGFRIARSAAITAPPAVVFAQVNNLHKWEGWSPWMKLDPGAKQAYEGPGEGTGAVFRWAGNAKVGEGSMTITASRPAELVTLRLDFLKPFAATNVAEFAFKPDGSRTAVTWSMTGKKSFIPKMFCMFMSMDRMVGDQFEKGLADLKSVSEAAAGR